MLTRHTRRIDKGIMQASVHTRGGGGSGPHLLARKRVDDGGEGVLGSLVQLHKSTAFWHIQELLCNVQCNVNTKRERERGGHSDLRRGKMGAELWWCVVVCGVWCVSGHAPAKTRSTA